MEVGDETPQRRIPSQISAVRRIMLPLDPKSALCRAARGATFGGGPEVERF